MNRLLVVSLFVALAWGPFSVDAGGGEVTVAAAPGDGTVARVSVRRGSLRIRARVALEDGSRCTMTLVYATTSFDGRSLAFYPTLRFRGPIVKAGSDFPVRAVNRSVSSGGASVPTAATAIEFDVVWHDDVTG